MSTSETMVGGRYRIDGLIGRGGMATVWRAHDTVLDREVAVKRLHTRLQGDPELEERFRREGRLVASLSHPNLVRLLDQGGEHEEPFLVFELVDGQDLKTLIRQHGRMAPERAAQVVAQIARALAEAHRAGVVHRDIKSHNVLVTRDGTAKLTDFGIARIVDVDGDLTRTGIVIGSSDYLSPEQAEGKQLDGRSDIYSLGVVLFEALTGRLPFSGENPVAVATKHVYENPPSPAEFVPELPDDVVSACMRSLRKSPRDRFPTGDAFAAALAPSGDGAHGEVGATPDGDTTSELPPVRGPHRRRGPTGRVAAAVAIVVAAIAAAFVWGPDALRDAIGGGSSAATLDYTAADYDPLGDDSAEHPGEVGNVSDDDPATSWSTETYRAASPTFGKAGVGLILELADPARVDAVVVTTSSPGAVVQILGAGETLDERPAVSAQATLAAGDNTIRVTTTEPQRQLVVWITTPGSEPLPDGGYRASIGQVRLEGTANSSR